MNLDVAAEIRPWLGREAEITVCGSRSRSGCRLVAGCRFDDGAPEFTIQSVVSPSHLRSILLSISWRRRTVGLAFVPCWRGSQALPGSIFDALPEARFH